VKAVIAVLAVVLAVPAGALADPNPAPPNARGTDVAAPEQQNPIAAPAHLPATGTDVAAADQQAPAVVAVAPAPAAVAHAEPGFDWTDAGVGALTAVLIGSTSLGAAVFVRRRHPAATGA
jgi:hypothetical protein